MKEKDELMKSQGKLTVSEKEDVKWIIEELQKFIENESVDELGLILLENINSSLDTVKRNYTQRVLSILKQNHMLD
jgi:hypothetical protein